MKTTKAIRLVILLITAVALAACATPTQQPTPTATVIPTTATPTPPPSPTPRLVLPANSAVYLLAEGEERGHLLSEQEVEALPDEVMAALRQRLEEGEAYRAQLTMQGAEPAVAVGVTAGGETTPFALVVTEAVEHPPGTLIIPAANGEPLFLEPALSQDQIAPVLIGERLTWGLFAGDRLAAYVDQFNRWSTESTLCREFWQEQLPKMGISVEGMTSAQIQQAGSDVLNAVKLWVAGQEGSLAGWDQIPAGWQYHRLADQETVQAAAQAGEKPTLAVVVTPDGQVYRAYWDPDWGGDYGFLKEVEDEEGNIKQVPVGARRIQFLAPLPEGCFDEQGNPRQGLEFGLSPDGAVQVSVGEEVYVYDQSKGEWVAVVTETPLIEKLNRAPDLSAWGLRYEVRPSGDSYVGVYVDVDGRYGYGEGAAVGQFVPDAVTTKRVHVYQENGDWVQKEKEGVSARGAVGLKPKVLDKVDVSGLPMFINLAEHKGEISLVEVELGKTTSVLLISEKGFELLAPFRSQVKGGAVVYFGGFKAKGIEIRDIEGTNNLYITASGVENHIDRLFTGIPTVLNRGEKIADITAEPNGFWQERGLSNVIVEFLQESDSDKDAGLFLDDIAIVQGDILFVY